MFCIKFIPVFHFLCECLEHFLHNYIDRNGRSFIIAMSLNSLNSFWVICQKSNNDLASKIIFNDLSADSSIRHSFHFMGGGDKEKNTWVTKGFITHLGHSLSPDKCYWFYAGPTEVLWHVEINCRSALLLSVVKELCERRYGKEEPTWPQKDSQKYWS